MQNKFHRKDFLKLAVLANASLLTKPVQAFTDNLSAVIPSLSINVVYYKKGDAQYEVLRKGFNKRINKFPAIIAQCNNTQGVAEAIQYAIANNLPVAVKSGGHCMEGFSCNNGGMVINLSALNKVSWVNTEIIKVGPGCTLSHLYDTILPKGKIIPAGSCGTVGVGGLVLGGGYGLMSRKLGLACDSLVEVTMVDGRGNIRNSNTDKDLLWACKGGGNGNFGVITELKFKTHTAPATLQSFRFKAYKVNTARAKAILKNWFEVSANLPQSCFSAYVLNGKNAYILLTTTEKPTSAIEKAIQQLSLLADKTTRGLPIPITSALKTFYGIQHPVYFKNSSAGLY
ncbi:MAG: FAD-binding oxidoreductase, partial [Sphingobacteriales bacterium]|nr:FAD-binding oxidoreductase [Sphingobacteriales bacterium]